MKKLYLTAALALTLFTFRAWGACPGQSQVIIQIVPDLYPDETTWSLHNDITGALIDTGNVHGDTICVSNTACLRFTIYDQYGDGICCAYGHGYYQVFMNGNMVAQGASFGHSETTYFNCPVGHDCSVPITAVLDTMTAAQPETWYYFIPDSTGIYNIGTCNLGNTCNTVIYMYDVCNYASVSNSNQGTIFYNDDGCSNNQSLISAQLQAGHLYYIRIGQHNNSCTGHTIKWLITYQGPVVGCTDPNSCNYNPLATVSDSSCVYPPNPLCPSPDLELDQDMLKSTIHADNITVGTGDCYVNEGCLAGYGVRNLIRFSTHIRNIGDADYFIGVPDSSNPQFVWDPCHQHWHYSGYAEYVLFDQQGQQVQVGFKDGFCVLDLECGGGGIAKYGCGNMGITAGCGDIYSSGLNCQWVDITDVDTGYYTLAVVVNWDHSPDKLGRIEKSYNNNWGQICLHLYEDSTGAKKFDTLPDCPLYVDCAGDTFGMAQADCAGNCNGSTVMGDLNVDILRDTTDMLIYLDSITGENILRTTCNDLNADGQVTVYDAARLNGCLRYTAHTLTNNTNAQTAQHLCQFPYNVSDFTDTVSFGIAAVDWQQHYIDINVYNPHIKLMGYELKLEGARFDSIKNLATGNYLPSLRMSPTGHITQLTNEDGSLYRQMAPLNLLRVYFSNLVDSTICLAHVIDVVNDNYEQVTGAVSNACVTQPQIDTSAVTSVAALVSESDLKVIPNPTTGAFQLYFSKSLQGASVKIFDAVGRQVFEQLNLDNLSNSMLFNLTGAEAGVYFLQLNSKYGTVVKRVMIVRNIQ